MNKKKTKKQSNSFKIQLPSQMDIGKRTGKILFEIPDKKKGFQRFSDYFPKSQRPSSFSSDFQKKADSFLNNISQLFPNKNEESSIEINLDDQQTNKNKQRIMENPLFNQINKQEIVKSRSQLKIVKQLLDKQIDQLSQINDNKFEKSQFQFQQQILEKLKCCPIQKKKEIDPYDATFLFSSKKQISNYNLQQQKKDKIKQPFKLHHIINQENKINHQQILEKPVQKKLEEKISINNKKNNNMKFKKKKKFLLNKNQINKIEMQQSKQQHKEIIEEQDINYQSNIQSIENNQSFTKKTKNHSKVIKEKIKKKKKKLNLQKLNKNHQYEKEIHDSLFPSQQGFIEFVSISNTTQQSDLHRYPKRKRMAPLMYWCQKKQYNKGQLIGIQTQNIQRWNDYSKRSIKQQIGLDCLPNYQQNNLKNKKSIQINMKPNQKLRSYGLKKNIRVIMLSRINKGAQINSEEINGEMQYRKQAKFKIGDYFTITNKSISILKINLQMEK